MCTFRTPSVAEYLAQHLIVWGFGVFCLALGTGASDSDMVYPQITHGHAKTDSLFTGDILRAV